MIKSIHSSFFFVLSLSAIVMATNLAFTSKVEARPCGRGWLDRLGCTLDPTNPRDNGSVFQSSFHVYVKNNSRKPITVTARYMNYFERGRGSCSTVDGRGENCPDSVTWVTYSWNITPSENALIITDAVGRNIYFSAKSQDRKLTWNEKEVDMGSQYGRFEYTFNE